MMTPNEKRNLLIAIIVLGIAAILLVLWFVFRPSLPQGLITSPPSTPVTDVGEPSEVVPRPIVPVDAIQAQTVARDFVERFGTYSSDAPADASRADVRDLATAALYASLPNTDIGFEEGYHGTTTYALAFKRIEGSEAEGRIVFEVSTQREGFQGDRSSSSVSYEKATVTVVKVGADWLVDGYAWE